MGEHACQPTELLLICFRGIYRCPEPDHRLAEVSCITSYAPFDFIRRPYRFLTNEQAAADSANFMSHVNFSSSGIEEDLTAPGTPWIYYGGSYAGARAAHMRVLYPDLVYGAIASSGVTHATIVYWEYYDLIRQAAEEKCVKHIQNTIKTVDKILDNGKLKHSLKKLFGLGDLEHDDDFASLLEVRWNT